MTYDNASPSPQLNILNKSKLSYLCSLWSLQAILFSSVGFAAESQVLSTPIRIGVIAPLTGSGASYGRGMLQGAELAVREVNRQGGIKGRPLELVVLDDGTEVTRSVIAMRRLVTSDVAAVAGGWGSQQVLANLEAAEQAGVPYIVAGATNPQITQSRNRWTFRLGLPDDVTGEMLARASVQTLGLRRIAVLHDANVYGVSNREYFLGALQNLGIQPITVHPYKNSQQDFGSELQQVAQSGAEGLVLLGTMPAVSLIAQQARKLGIKARILGPRGLANEAYISADPSAAEGTFTISSFSEDLDRPDRKSVV